MIKEVLRIENAVTYSELGKSLNQSRLNVFVGEVVGIMGMNNAGKTELVQGISGAAPFASARMYLEEKEVSISSIEKGRQEGIYYISQESSLISQFAVWENFQLRPKDRRLLNDDKATRMRCSEMMELLSVRVNIEDRVDTLSVKEKLLVEIAKAIYYDAKILIFDDILNTMSAAALDEFEHLFRLLSSLHISVILVDNSIRFIKRYCHRLFIMRGGKTAAILSKSEMEENYIIALMMGTTPPKAQQEYYTEDEEENTVLLDVREVTFMPVLSGVSFSLRRGEQVGMLNVNKHSGETVRQILQGRLRPDEGEVIFRSQPLSLHSPEDAVKCGIAVFPKPDTFFPNLSLQENILLPALQLNSRFGGVLNEAELKYRAHELMTEYIIEYYGLVVAAEDLEHNRILRRKLSLCRMLSTQPDLVVLSNPTQGMDVTSRDILLKDIRTFKKKKITSLIISPDIYELLTVCERILITNEGKVELSIQNNKENRERLLLIYRQYLKGI